MIYCNFPDTTGELFRALEAEGQLEGFIFGVDFNSELEAQTQLYNLIIGLEDAAEGYHCFRFPGFDFTVKLQIFHLQRKFIFSRMFLN